MKTATKWADEMMGEYNTHGEHERLTAYVREIQADARRAALTEAATIAENLFKVAQNESQVLAQQAASIIEGRILALRDR